MSQTYKTRAQFQSKSTLEKRKGEFAAVQNKYPENVVIYVDSDDKNTLELSKNKFIVPKDMTFGQFATSVRKHMKKLTEKAALTSFIHTKGTQVMATHSRLLGELHNDYKDEDGCMYVTMVGENVFG